MPWPLTEVKFTDFHEALLIIHAHDQQPFHQRLFLALDGLFKDSNYALEVFGGDGSYQMESNFPFEECHDSDIYVKTAQRVQSRCPMYERPAAGGRQVMKLSEFLPLRQLDRNDLYHDVFIKFGASRQIGIPLESEGSRGGLTITRKCRDYSREDMTLASIVAPQIAKAFEVDCMMKHRRPALAKAETADFTAMRKLGLSKRESEVMLWLMMGKRDSEIAVILGTSVRTVNQQVRTIFKKLSVETRTAAVAVVAEMGHVPAGC